MSKRVSEQLHLGRTFAALRYPNYRLWFWGQMVSLFGTWMQSTAQSFLIFELTRSPAYLGYLGFAFGAPAWLFSLYGGVIADRMSRRQLMVITQSCMMVLAFLLAALTFLNMVQPWHIILLTFCLGTANAIDAPARLALVTELVDREDLTNAIALNATMFNSGTAIGPAAAGLTYALFGPGWCFVINGLSFVAVIIALQKMNLKPFVSRPRRESVILKLKEGVRYVGSEKLVLTILAIVATTSLFGVSAATLFPSWAVTILGGDATTNGLLQSARGVGSLAAALTIAWLGRFTYRGKLLTAGMFAFPIFLLLFAFVRWLPLSLFLLVCLGGAIIFVVNLANSTMQNIVPDSLRGRVMSIYSLTFFGFMPLGALLIGVIAESLDERTALVLSALVSLLCAFIIWKIVPQLRKS
ncbi:MAG: MFS transporter [Bacteroidota bacterium]